jgi:enoyl-[acyl-carrier protein] reductase I
MAMPQARPNLAVIVMAADRVPSSPSPKRIRVNAISAGAVATRAASGIEHFDELLNETIRKAPLRRRVDSCEVGRVALLLASDYTTAITGEVLHVDAGFHIEGVVFH